MKVGIPTFGCDDGRSGIGRYVVNLLAQLPQRESCPDMELLTFPGQRDTYLARRSSVACHSIQERYRSPVANIAWHQFALPRVQRRNGYDVVFLPAANRRLSAALSCPTVGAVHDLSSFHVENKYDPARMFYIKKVLPLLINRLSHVITMSESSKRDIVEYANVPENRITVAPLGVNHEQYYPERNSDIIGQVRQFYGLKEPYILYVSRLEHPGKNHVRLIKAFELVKSRQDTPHQLVLAGGDWNRAEEIHEAAANSPFADDIILTGFVPGEHLRPLYSGAEMLAFPSLYEGFGLPVLEAMACGTPVACSNLSSLPEIANESALLFDPYSIEEMASTISSYVESTDVRNQYRKKGIARSREYSWQRTADMTIEVLQNAGRSAE